MPEHKKSSKSGNKPTRFRPTKNRIEIKRSFICFDSRCVCGGLLLVFKIKTLCWDLVMDEDRERARVSAELGTPLEEIVKETPNIGLDEKLLGECEKCGRPHYFCDPKLYHPTNFIEWLTHAKCIDLDFYQEYIESFTGYREVKYRFIKGLIEGTSWKHEAQRKYIDNLVRLENYVLNGTKRKAGAMMYERLKVKHYWEWKRIFQELRPEEFTRVKKIQRLEDEKLAQYVEKTMKESANREKCLK